MQIDEVGYMDKCNMMVVIHPDSHCALTVPSITRMPSLGQILLVHCVCNLDCVFLIIRNRQDHITLIECQSTQFGVWNFCITCMTLAPAQMNSHVSQFVH